MIGHLSGRILASTPDTVVLETGGVGYELHVPLSTFSEIERAGSRELSLFVHTHVREDAIELFGFWSRRERAIFRKLIAVSGIGPKLARVILSGMAPDDLLSALADGDAARLSTIPGIGKKTAERMVLELRDKVQDLASELPERPVSREDDDLVQALVNLGYKEKDAKVAVERAREGAGEATFHELLPLALKSLSRV